ncbi:hypothetical protein VLF92_12565 [Pseudomonas chengduensis]
MTVNFRLGVTVKLLAVSAAWLRDEAVRFARSLPGAMNITRSRIVDGYIMKASRVGNKATVYLIDTPGTVAVPGRALVGGPGSGYEPAHCPLIDLPGGRDDIARAWTRGPASLFPDHAGCPPLPVVLGGTLAPAVSVIESRIQPSLSVRQGIGVVELTVPLYMPGPYVVNPYAFVGRGDSNIVYLLNLYSPAIARALYSVGGDGWEVSDHEVPSDTWSIAVSDSALWDTAGALPFCKRIAPPAYDPDSSAATVFSAAQQPWARAIQLSTGVDDEGQAYFDTLLVIHAVAEMRNDDDRYGAKGLWFGVVRGIQPESAGPYLDLPWFSLDDTRLGSEPLMVPVLDPVDDVYSSNTLYPAMLARLDSGMVIAVVLHLNYASVDEGFAPFNAVYAYRWSEGGLTKDLITGPVAAMIDPTDGQPHDFSFPIGIDTDGETAYAVFFSSDMDYSAGARTTETSIDIVALTAAGAVMVLSELIPQRYCRNIVESRFSCVRYIGNGKYLFPATDQIEISPGVFNSLGDLVVMLYDSNLNVVSVAGVVVAERQLRTNLFIGALDCPVLERVDGGVIVRQATVIITFGGLGQSAGEPGVEGGQTFISADSGATWSVMADFGSPAGAYYCGTALKIRE